ncbi:NAD-dependent epimerase/dehydratase family protein [Candidatus Pelagibacter sp.]|nr:NAD-dependent epimerase/dehydratase family protein [Candidatus Pelagibacter sp.]
MKILITGGCGFIGTNLALFLHSKGFKIDCLDNLSRKGSQYNLNLLKEKNIKNFNIDIYDFKKIQRLPKYSLIIDCCAEASVEISKKDINRVVNTNFIGTLNILNKVKKDKSKIIFLSSSRVYPVKKINDIFEKKDMKKKLSISKTYGEKDNILGPKTLYGVSKLASEMLIEEFSYAFDIKFIINRCGVVSGPLQFGKQDQGFVSLWIWGHLNKKKMKYIGYGGFGNQVRDVMHVYDLCELILLQINKINKINNKMFTVGGSKKSYTSLIQLTKICEKITKNKIKFTRSPKTSIYDIPYFITNNNLVTRTYGWKPKKNIFEVVTDTFLWLKNNKSKISKYF